MRIFGDGKKRRELCQREENAAAALLEKLRRVSEELTARGVFVRRQTNLNTAEISPMGVGGTCAAAFYPDTLATFTELITALKKAEIPYAVLGSAANVLIPDGSEEAENGGAGGGYLLRGALVFTKYLRSIAVDGESVFAFCGVTGAELLYRTRAANLSGAEFLEGIPCTAGGAAYMNAGAGGKHVSDILESALVYGDGDMRVYTAKECGFSYKESAFMKRGEAILGITLRLKKSSPAAVEAAISRAKEARAQLLQTYRQSARRVGCW